MDTEEVRDPRAVPASLYWTHHLPFVVSAPGRLHVPDEVVTLTSEPGHRKSPHTVKDTVRRTFSSVTGRHRNFTPDGDRLYHSTTKYLETLAPEPVLDVLYESEPPKGLYSLSKDSKRPNRIVDTTVQ